jgi:hypothetical protein
LPGIDLCGCGKGISGKSSERTVTGQDLGEVAHLPGQVGRDGATGRATVPARVDRPHHKLSSAGSCCVGGKELIGRSAAVGSISVTLPGKAAQPKRLPLLETEGGGIPWNRSTPAG